MSDDDWALIGPLLPSEGGRDCGSAGDNRRNFEGMVWMARTGAQWRHLPDECSKWNNVFRRCRLWVTTGVFNAISETFAERIEALLADKGCGTNAIRDTLVKAESRRSFSLPAASTAGAT